MPRERVRALQAERLARQLDRVWAHAGAVLPAQARGRRSAARGSARARRPRAIPTTVKAELRAARRSIRPSATTAARRRERGGPAGRVDRHQRPADADPLDAQGPRGRPRRVGPRPLALGAAPRDEPRQRASLRHERRRLALQPRGRGARRAQHPVGPAGRRGARARRRSRCGGGCGRTCTGSSATSRRRTPTRRARRGLDPARDLNLTLAGDHPSEQYLMASSGPRGAAAARQRLRRARRRAPRRGPRHRRGDRPAHRPRARSRRARQPGGHGAREGQLPPALRPRGRGAAERDAVPVRRDAPPPVLRGSRARRRRRSASRDDPADRRGAGPLRVPGGVDAVGRVPDRPPSGEPRAALHVRCEHAAGRRAGAARARASPSASAIGSACRRASSWCRAAGCRGSRTRRRASSTRDRGRSPMALEVTGIDHLYVSVSRLRAVVAFYDPVMRLLGFRKGTSPIAGEAARALLQSRDAVHAAPAAKRGVAHDPYAPGLHHLCLRVATTADVDAAARGLRALGVDATEPAPLSGVRARLLRHLLLRSRRAAPRDRRAAPHAYRSSASAGTSSPSSRTPLQKAGLA